jgi:hypothetical protein
MQPRHPLPLTAHPQPPNIGVLPTASLLNGGHDRKVWFWIPLTILMIGVWSIPSGIGVALSAVVFVYLMRRRTRRTTAQRGLRCWFRVLGPAAAIAIRRGDGSTAVRVSQTIDRENAAAVVTARSGAGAVVIDDLR